MEIQKISDHGRTRNGKQRTTNKNWSMFTVVVGKGSKKQSITVHGTREQAEVKAALYK